MEQIDKLYKEVSMQIEMNQELKQDNETLKKELLAHQKELARFKEKLRSNPLSQLKVLHEELSIISEQVDEIIENEGEDFALHILGTTRQICVDAFNLLSTLKERTHIRDHETT